jgi:2-phospho-L-lactate guanylyltransferase
MDLWAIIPVKRFDLGKSRLAAELDGPERVALNQRLFARVFDAAQGELGAERVVVVTTDSALLAAVRRNRAHAVPERTAGDLNAALAQACHYASERGARAVAVLPSDLPEINGEDIAALRDALGPPPSCAIAPDATEQGTNALALAPPSTDFFRFGPRSFASHIALAEAGGMTVQIVRRPGLAHDLDTPEAYRRFADTIAAFKMKPALLSSTGKCTSRSRE